MEDGAGTDLASSEAATGTASTSRAPHPWPLRLFESTRLAPAWVGAGLAAAAIGLFLASELALGRISLLIAAPSHPYRRANFVIALILLAMLAYVPTASAYVLRGARRTLDELRPALRGSASQLGALYESVGCYDARARRAFGVFGVLLALSTPLLTDRTWAVYSLRGSLFEPEATWHRVAAPLLGWLIAGFIYVVVAESQRLSRVGRELVEVDLFERSLLEPFARQGLRNALLAMGLLSIAALLLVDPSPGPGFTWVPLGLVALAGAMAGFGLVLPVRGVRERIRRTKRAELEWCAAAIRSARASLGARGGAATETSPRLADLVAYRGLVESVSEWPFDAPVLTRFTLYLAIPLGSWLGGAMVERLVDTTLG